MKFAGTVQSNLDFFECRDIFERGISLNIDIKLIDCDYKRKTLLNRLRRIPILKNNKLKTCAGKAVFLHYKYGQHIQLHPACFDLNDEINTLKGGQDTFLHEIAHHIAFMFAKHAGHGEPWKHAMSCFGIAPKARYNSRKYNYLNYKKRAETRLVTTIAANLPEF